MPKPLAPPNPDLPVCQTSEEIRGQARQLMGDLLNAYTLATPPRQRFRQAIFHGGPADGRTLTIADAPGGDPRDETWIERAVYRLESSGLERVHYRFIEPATELEPGRCPACQSETEHSGKVLRTAYCHQCGWWGVVHGNAPEPT